MLRLYYLPGACSLVPHTALEWIGVDFDAQAVDHTIIKSPEYLALNPNGQVPLLQEGSWTLTQNVAILDYLNDVYPQAKLYGSGDARAVAYAREWLAFLNADLHKAFSLIFGAARFPKMKACKTLCARLPPPKRSRCWRAPTVRWPRKII